MSPRAEGGGVCYVVWSVKHHPLDLSPGSKRPVGEQCASD
jgi:hypothetical protein